MFKSKYSTILTILLIVLIIAIVIVGIVLAVNTYKDYVKERDAKKAFGQLDPVEYDNTDVDDSEEDIVPDLGLMEPITNNTTEDTTTTLDIPKVKFYKNYPMIGNIDIPKTGASYPILLDTSSKALDMAVGVTYPSSPELNKAGNVVIIGHNYRNGKFFSDNDKLEVGDIIKIKDLEGKTLSYKIYEIFQTTPTDAAYMTRDTGGNIEISLSTCTDDGNNRLVILARAE